MRFVNRLKHQFFIAEWYLGVVNTRIYILKFFLKDPIYFAGICNKECDFITGF